MSEARKIPLSSDEIRGVRNRAPSFTNLLPNFILIPSSPP